MKMFEDEFLKAGVLMAIALAIVGVIGIVMVHRSGQAQDRAVVECVKSGRAPLECKAALK